MKLRHVIVYSMLSVLVGSAAFANTPASRGAVVERDGRYIYIKTPLHSMTTSLRRAVFRNLTVILGKRLKSLYDKNELPKELDHETITTLKEAYVKIDELIVQIDEMALNKSQTGHDLGTMIPSAVMVFIGPSITGNLKLGGGGSLSFGLVAIPMYVQRRAIVPVDGEKEVTEYMEFKTFFIGWPNLDIGGGALAGSTVRAGIGLIWNLKDDPDEFMGPLGGYSSTIGKGNIGFNFKQGVLRSSKTSKWYPFITAAMEYGAIAGAGGHFNLSYVIDGMKVLSAFGFEADVAPTLERVPVPESSAAAPVPVTPLQ